MRRLTSIVGVALLALAALLLAGQSLRTLYHATSQREALAWIREAFASAGAALPGVADTDPFIDAGALASPIAFAWCIAVTFPAISR